jgi:hypothetical protein
MQPEELQHKFYLDQKWLHEKEIDLTWFSGRLVEPLVRRAVSRFALMRKQGYEPDNKKLLPIYFQDFLYNSQQKKSWFLFCCFHEPVEVNYSDKVVLELNDFDRSILLQHKHIDWSEKAYLSRAVKLLNWYKKNVQNLQIYNCHITDAMTFWQTRFSDIASFLDVIDEYSKTWKEWTIGNFGIGNSTWEYFIRWCRETYGVELDPSPTEIVNAKKIKEREDKRAKAKDDSRLPESVQVGVRRDQLRDELLAELKEEM